MRNENEIYQRILDLIKEFYEKYRNWILSISVVVGIIIFVSLATIIKIKQTKARAQEKIATVESLIYQNRKEDALKILDEIISGYKKPKYKGYAMYLKANFLYEEGNFQQAKEVCLNFLNLKKPKAFILPIMYILAQCYLSLNDFDEAIKIYNEIIQKYPEHYLTARVYESLAICYEFKGDIQNAKQIYERMNILYPGSYWSEISQQKLKGM